MVRFLQITRLLKIEPKVYHLFGVYIELHSERVNLISFINETVYDDYPRYFTFLQTLYVAIVDPSSNI